ncbi:hypothetical protein [Taklimakanibacter deserti]|uniref:hypothetical protein n=1 Tax=Taklimakanibacter deserti TaxID=2267839 RepID=UPI0013C405F4
MSDGQKQNAGSRWHRWEPHIHAPGTILNDQFKGDDPWEEYLNTLEEASPPIRAIGVTDYYRADSYLRMIKAKEQGRLEKCDLIFPNIEVRLAIGTVRVRWANLHLLVSPEDPKHLDEISRILAQLTFKAYDDTFSCREDDLIRLGKAVAKGVSDGGALVRGAEQFKVSFEQLKQVYNDSA